MRWAQILPVLSRKQTHPGEISGLLAPICVLHKSDGSTDRTRPTRVSSGKLRSNFEKYTALSIQQNKKTLIWAAHELAPPGVSC